MRATRIPNRAGAFVPRHAGAVVGVKEHDSNRQRARPLPTGRDAPHILVHDRDAVVESGHLPAHEFGVFGIEGASGPVFRGWDLLLRQTCLDVLQKQDKARPMVR